MPRLRSLWLAPLVAPAVAWAWHPYLWYEPTIEHGLVVDTANNPHNHMYNHDSSLAWFDGQWIAVWNSGLDREGHRGQINVMATSRDALNWTAPEVAFSDPRRSVNPIDGDPLDQTVQWQPNLLVVDNQLWCVWSILDFLHGIDRLATRGVYFSTLDEAGGRWTNRLLRWETDPVTGRAVSRRNSRGTETTPVSGRETLLFPSQNPIRLQSGRHAGRVLAPVTTRGTGTTGGVRENGVIYSDDAGATWHMSEPILFAESPLLWEPTVYEMGPDHVGMIARCRATGTISDPARILIFCESFDGGVTWSECAWIPVETISSRMHVLPTLGRYAMLYNDHRHRDNAGDRQIDRVNLALFFSRSGRISDWHPANSVSRPNQYGVSYPQAEIRDGALHLIYSDGASRSLRTAIVSPLPTAESRYVFPRGLSQPRPELSSDAVLFEFGQHLDTRWHNTLEDSLGVGVHLVASHGGTVIDGLSADGQSGFLFYLHRSAPDLHTHYPALYLPGAGHFVCAEGIPAGRLAYVGVTVRDGTEIEFTVNGNNRRTHAAGYHFRLSTPAALASHRPLRFGVRRRGSVDEPSPLRSIRNFRGELIQARVFAHPPTLSDHETLRRARAPAPLPSVVDLSPASFLDNAFVLPPFQGVATSPLPDARRFSGEGSASLELENVSKGSVFRYGFDVQAPQPTEPLVLFTLGDPADALRVELMPDGKVRLRQGSRHDPLGSLEPLTWTPLEVRLDRNAGRVTVMIGPSQTSVPSSVGPRAFLGQGYREVGGNTRDHFDVRKSSPRYNVD